MASFNLEIFKFSRILKVKVSYSLNILHCGRATRTEGSAGQRLQNEYLMAGVGLECQEKSTNYGSKV